MMKHYHQLLKALCPLILAFFILIALLLTACDGITQAQETYTIGVVNYVPSLERVLEGFKVGMAERGYIEDKNITYIYNGVTEPDPQVMDGEIKSLLDQKVDMFLTLGTLPTLTAKKAVEGTDIPIVFAPVINPVEEGAVASIRQPGGNVTGVQNGNTIAKAMEWLHKIAPQATKIYVFYHPKDTVAVTSVAGLPETAASFGIELVLNKVDSLEEAIAIIETLPQEAAIFIIPTPSLEPLSALIEVAVKHGIAVGSTNSSQLKAGALVTYGADFFAMGRQAAGLAEQIFKGIKPADLPVETAEYFLSINLQTAKTIGLDIPDEILRQADTVVR